MNTPGQKPIPTKCQPIYDFILSFARKSGRLPTQREIADGTQLCLSVVNQRMVILQARGYIVRNGRAIQYTVQGFEICPCCGRAS